jgi:transcriptional regulator with XRE-family HTH domain
MLMERQESDAVAAAEAEARRLMALLAVRVRLSKRSMRSLETELGLSSSVVGKILSGVIRPQLSYLLMIAAAIGVSPEEFFASAYPQPPEPPDLDARIEAIVQRTLSTVHRKYSVV